MGDEIHQRQFTRQDYQRFQKRLDKEMSLLEDLFLQNRFDISHRKLGYELELCLLHPDGSPAGSNEAVLEAANNDLFTYELARFNLEINGHVFDVNREVFNQLGEDLSVLYRQVKTAAHSHSLDCGLFGVLPSLQMQHLDQKHFMSEMQRYRLLNQRVMAMRGRPVELEIQGADSLQVSKNDVMLEALGTSLQIHYQLPLLESVDAYHAALWASIPVLAASANSPLVLQKLGWQESRIAIFKQAVDCRDNEQKQNGDMGRVFLGQGYVDSLYQLFEQNQQFSPILPEVIDTDIETLHHVNLHNGTIWRWVRPIVEQNPDGNYHLRLELRVTPAGPTLVDTLANLVFYIGLIEGLKVHANDLTRLPYGSLEHYFYLVARQGLAADIQWCQGGRSTVQQLILKTALPLAYQGLLALDIDGDQWLDIIEQRVGNGKTGARWISRFWMKYPEPEKLVQIYQQLSSENIPVHQWPES